jgi:hypothetical protein
LIIDRFILDGVVKVCDVRSDEDRTWYYVNQDPNLLYLNHRSWVYFVVSDNVIVKIGESGNPLGIANKVSSKYPEIQPCSNTTSRLGRIRRHPGGTDQRIRDLLHEDVQNNKVSIWAKRCEILEIETKIDNVIVKTKLTSHKDQEMLYLDYVKNIDGNYPLLNQMRK